MILEVFGPSGAGKTTLASLLAKRLQSQGRDVTLMAGVRTHPLRRSALKCLAGARSLTVDGQFMTSTNVLGILPPKHRLWSIRLRWHLALLFRAWNESLSSDKIVIFDQGTIQAVASLVLLSGVTNRERVASALRLVPKPDLLIRLEAPREIREARLRVRQLNLGVIQRLLEVNVQSSLDHLSHIDLVSNLLGAFALPVIRVNTPDQPGLDRAIDTIARETLTRLRPPPDGSVRSCREEWHARRERLQNS